MPGKELSVYTNYLLQATDEMATRLRQLHAAAKVLFSPHELSIAAPRTDFSLPPPAALAAAGAMAMVNGLR